LKTSYNTSLRKYNTFGLDYKTKCLISVKNEKEAISLFTGEVSWESPLFILGGGSNILFISDFQGTIMFPEFSGIKVEERDGENVIISAGAGVSWDKLVEWTVNNGFGGLENLSLIPGMVGASPIQNIGAYGVEVKDRIERVRTISVSDGSVHLFSNNECEFDYRNSIFKKKEKGRYLVTRVYYKLTVNPELNLNYGSLKDEINRLGKPSLKTVRQAVINIRRSKLPDPVIIGNAGSFFKNPLVNRQGAQSLKNTYPAMPLYEDPSGATKLAAGWLIEQCGWKAKRLGEAGVHDKQALVIVNHGNATGTEIYTLSESIKKSVAEKFGIELEREVEIVGTT
jgi:UDP-N-acetylmuramate dehydrogenase